ncbi:MAG: cofactor-independent phosphoglycerate mutase [Thermodesulfovibrionia bacterium]
MADRPLKTLDNKTCLQKADTPYMDSLAREGEVGMVKTIPDGFEPGSDIANLSILGYDPKRYYSGRAPLEAAFRGIELHSRDIAFRCNLVTLGFEDDKEDAIMEDYSAGHISTDEARRLINEINKRLGSSDISFYPGVSYRHLMVWRHGKDKIRCTPPHDISGKRVKGHLPKGEGADILKRLINNSVEILQSHPVNINRVRQGLPPANSIWLWGNGKAIRLPNFRDRYGLNGAVISAVDLMKGIGISAGLDIINVRGATGYLDTNYLGKARAALRALAKVDFVYLHVEAPDEAGHSGDFNLKIKAIEDFDSKVVGTIINGMGRFKEYRILLLPDHATPISVKTHTKEPVPFVIYDSRIKMKTDAGFNESIKKRKGIRVFEDGYRLMDYFIKGSNG